MLTGASEKTSEKVAFDPSKEQTVVFSVELWWRDIPSRGPACSKAWRLESVAYLENRK